MFVFPYSNTHGTTDYTERWDQCRRLKFSLYVFEGRSENAEKLYSNSLVNSIIQRLQTASLFSSAQRDCQQGLTLQHCSHNPISYTAHTQQMQNKADGSLHIPCGSWTCCCRVLSSNFKVPCVVAYHERWLEMKSSVSDMVGAPELVAFMLPSSLSYSIPDGRLNCCCCQHCWSSQGSSTQANILFFNLNWF